MSASLIARNSPFYFGKETPSHYSLHFAKPSSWALLFRSIFERESPDWSFWDSFYSLWGREWRQGKSWQENALGIHWYSPFHVSFRGTLAYDHRRSLAAYLSVLDSRRQAASFPPYRTLSLLWYKVSEWKTAFSINRPFSLIKLIPSVAQSVRSGTGDFVWAFLFGSSLSESSYNFRESAAGALII